MSEAAQAIYDASKTFMQGAEQVKVALDKTTAPTTRRAFLRLDRRADLSKQSEAAQKRIKMADDWVASFRRTTLDPMLRGGRFKTDDKGSYLIDPLTKINIFESWPEGVWDVYGIRNVNYILAPLLVKFDELTQLSDLKLIVPIAREAVKRMKDTGNGYRAYINWRENPDDPRALDQLLIMGPLAALDWCLWVNRSEPEVPNDLQQAMSLMMNEDLIKGLFHRSINDYRQDGKRDARLALWAELKANRRYDGTDQAKRDGVLTIRQILDEYHKRDLYLPYDRWGHGLYHPSMSLHCAATIRKNQYGWAEDAEVAQRSGEQINECRVLVETSKGTMEVHPHFVPARNNWVRQYASQKLTLDQMEYCDITYPRESGSTEELALRAGSPFVTPELMGGFARTFVWCGLPDGPRASTIAATIGGRAPLKYTDQRVMSIRGGQEIIKGPYKLSRPDPEKKDFISAARRGPNAMGVRFADAATRREVELLNDHLEASGRGHDVPLMLCHTKRV